MAVIKIKSGYVFIVGLIFCAAQAAPIFSQSFSQAYIDAANDYLQTARNGLNQAEHSCQEIDCDPGFISQLNDLRGSVNWLSQLLGENPPNGEAIRDTIQRMAPLVQAVCNQIGGCADLGAGADTKDRQGASPSACGQPRSFNECWQCAWQQRNACIQNTNRLLNCWQRVPFCDWRGWPFDPSFYQDCQDFISQGLLPNCRCGCPQSERQGGCPSFFQTGAACSDCSYASCQSGGDPRCSCNQAGAAMAGWNKVQCDLCRWGNVGATLAEFRRNFF